MKFTKAEREFITHYERYGMLNNVDLPELIPQYKFHPTRKWRFDFAHVITKTAIEIDGGVWKRKSGHTTGKGYTEDRYKDNAAIEQGWVVLRYTPQMLEADPLTVIKQIIDIISARS